MKENLYKRYSEIRDLKGYTDYKVSKLIGTGTATLSNWKNGKYQIKDDKIRKISEVLGVTSEFLKGETEFVECPVCNLSYNPLNKFESESHELFHSKIILVKEKYPFFMNLGDSMRIKESSIFGFRNKDLNIGERLEYWDNYLKSSFCLQIINMDYMIDELDFEDFCKREVATLKPDYCITEDFLDLIIEKYGVDKSYMDLIDDEVQLLSRVAKNEQLMRIIKYAELLSPDILNSIEIQIEALVKNNKEGN